VLVPCAVLWTQLYALGSLNEGRAISRRLEVLRLLVVVPLAAAVAIALDAAGLAPTTIVIDAAAYVASSLIALLWAPKRILKTIN
jgi:hypothetical protein